MTTQGNVAKNDSYIRNAKRIGGTRINDDWQYLEEQPLPDNPTTDQIFNQGYRQQGLGKRKIERTNREEDDNVIDLQNYRARATGNRYLNQQQNGFSKNVGKLLKNKVLSQGLDIVNKRKTLAVNRSIMYWGGYLWLFVQLPFATLCVVTFALMGGISAIGESISESNILFKLLSSIVDKTLDFLKSLTGVGLTDVVAALFFLFYIITFTVGMLTLLGAYLQHNTVMNNPLNGEASGLKMGALLLAIIGYSVPLLNMFPWVLVWLFTISKYPR
ncbi:MAG: hypothetical protein UZ19_OD1000567 [Parcubacteria bacterium OLB19]|nr:MAG: hypothetical protein UZ19_OD1000567 [Parcubacteria bacterium OLB19]